jgi:hypothetical protein
LQLCRLVAPAGRGLGAARRSRDLKIMDPSQLAGAAEPPWTGVLIEHRNALLTLTGELTAPSLLTAAPRYGGRPCQGVATAPRAVEPGALHRVAGLTRRAGEHVGIDASSVGNARVRYPRRVVRLQRTAL